VSGGGPRAAREGRLARRARIVADVRSFFEARGFLEVETPLLVPSPGLDVHLSAFSVATPSGERYLSTSPEYQMKRLLADGYGAIFQITKAFRKDEVGEHHNPEFTILEWYHAPGSVDLVMKDTEQLVAKVTGGSVVLDEREHLATPPFARMTVLEAYERFAGASPGETLAMALEDEERFFRLLVDKVEPGLLEMGRAVFLTEYPASQASLARKKESDPRVAERFELYLGGVELCNGFGELTDPVEQRERFERDQKERRERDLPVYPVDERFLDALTKGLPSCAGNALGLDRLIALACGSRRIGDFMAFPYDEL
jgi:elongation factor P--(R)-beta-lysine ligase